MGAIIAIHFFLLLPLHPLKNISSANASQLTLFQALMCEEIFSNAPRNPTIVFSIAQGKAVCFSSFDEVPQKTIIYHNIGPWRVEISDAKGNVLAVLRFSVTD
jgi:hypothetical protein